MKIFFKFINVFSLFRNYLPLEKGEVLHFKKLKSPSPKDTLCQVSLKLAQWFWRRFLNFVNVFCYFVISSTWKRTGFFNFINVFLLFPNYLPLEKGGALHLNKLESPSPKDALCHVWVELAQWVLRRRFFNFVDVFLLFPNYLPLE